MSLPELPSTVIALILGKTDDLQDLVNLVCSCRGTYEAFETYTFDALVARPTLLRELPFAVAAQHFTSTESVAEERSWRDVQAFVDDMVRSPEKMYDELNRMRSSELLNMCKTAYFVQELVGDMGNVFRQRLNVAKDIVLTEEAGPGMSPEYFSYDIRGLSSSEQSRFLTAVYRTEILLQAFKAHAGIATAMMCHARAWLLNSFSIIEIEQIQCVYAYLESRFDEDCDRILDKDFGFGIDDLIDLTSDTMEQRWISQGCAFVCQLRRVNRQRASVMLLSKIHADSASPYLALSELGNCYRTCNNLTKPRDKLDHVEGPVSAYYQAHKLMPLIIFDFKKYELRLYPSAFDPRNWALYWVGYVPWDHRRVKDCKLWSIADWMRAQTHT
ncbi:uncharacterized protein F5Z01DRAFT_230769 [Emericellopsis atlantica]|uniref:Uncharacterized protein n=1 Tax=Emericellopsis atlantica TaxID=2614577 RepID=A0A9P7ZIM1_9HYPO|nr:uncharacterized protein F5Z01DRAFT_230769 [Emericellopsis atlantica]KAG9252487.1 hypothetical protein F5Z01DRAFT_230769 [Emericellopsis atlantica]